MQIHSQIKRTKRATSKASAVIAKFLNQARSKLQTKQSSRAENLVKFYLKKSSADAKRFRSGFCISLRHFRQVGRYRYSMDAITTSYEKAPFKNTYCPPLTQDDSETDSPSTLPPAHQPQRQHGTGGTEILTPPSNPSASACPSHTSRINQTRTKP